MNSAQGELFNQTDLKNAIEIYTDVRIKAPELTTTLINDPKSLATKEYIETGQTFLTLQPASAPTVNNAFFVDSADGVLKFKDNTGAVKIVNLS